MSGLLGMQPYTLPAGTSGAGQKLPLACSRLSS